MDPQIVGVGLFIAWRSCVWVLNDRQRSPAVGFVGIEKRDWTLWVPILSVRFRCSCSVLARSLKAAADRMVVSRLSRA